jgi:hypothetical protein
MSHVLTVRPKGREIHIGLRNGNVIVCAAIHGIMFELIPANVFHSRATFDLPFSLINDCVHWLDLKTGILEIRQRPDIWCRKLSNWSLDVTKRKAQRRTVTLINAQSSIFHAITNIFRDFEHPEQITVYQPEFRRLSVELRRLELTFTVNGVYLAQS